MRIAYISADPGVPVFGCKGCSVHVQEVMREMLDHGARLDLFATRVGGDTPAGLDGVALHRLPPLPKSDLAIREAAAIAVNDALLEALEREGPFDMIYERYSLWSYAGMRQASIYGIPGMLEVNAPLIEEQAEHRGLVNHSTAMNVARAVFNRATAVLAVSEGVAGYVRGFGADPDHVQVVPNGVNPRRFNPSLPPSLSAPHGVFTVGFVGTLKPWHGLPTLVEAFDQLHRSEPLTRLLVVGDGGERGRIEADLAVRGLSDAVHFTGLVDPSEIPGLLASMDVATAPYPDRPGLYFSPLKLFEYMAAGLPVIASRIGQISEVIEDDVTGVLCPPGDAAALAAALERLRREPTLRAQIGAQARTVVLRRHTWQAVVERVFDLAGFGDRAMSPLLAQPQVARAGR